MSDLSISALGALTGAATDATNDVIPIVDVSDTTMAPTGTDKKVSPLELIRAQFAAVLTDRGVVAPSTAYVTGDVLLLANGLRILAKQPFTSTVTATVATLGTNGQPNYIVIDAFQMVPAYLTGVNAANGASTNTLAIAVAFGQGNATGANLIGRMVELPYGILSFTASTIDATACIHVPNACGMYGQGRHATYLSLATGANCSMIRLHTSSGAGNPNAWFCTLRNFGVDGRGTAQGTQVNDCTLVAASAAITSPTFVWPDNYYIVGSGILPDTKIVPGSQTNGGHDATMTTVAQQAITGNAIVWAVAQQCFGILSRTNPLTTQQSGDWGFDPSHVIENLYMKNMLHDCIRTEGRGGITIRNNLMENCWSNGITCSFDTTISDNNIGFMSWHGIVIDGSSVHLTNNKTYNMGQFVGGAGAAWNMGKGVKSTSRNGIVISSHDCQQTTGSSFEFINCKGLNLSGVSANPGYRVGSPTGSSALGAAGAFHIELDNCAGCIIHLTGFTNGTDTGLTPSTARGYRLINGSDKNEIHLTHLGSGANVAGPAESADTVRLANTIIVNATAIQFSGLLSSAALATAYPKTYGRVAAGGMFYTPGVVNAGPAGVLNRAESVPIYPPRNGMTVKDLTIRVWTATATAIVRACVYTSDFSGSDTWNLLGELPSTFDCSTTGIKTIAFTSPLVNPDDIIDWVTTVPQVAVATSYACAMGNNVATGNAWGNFALGTAGISGAFAATLVPGTTGIGTGISTVATLNN